MRPNLPELLIGLLLPVLLIVGAVVIKVVNG